MEEQLSEQDLETFQEAAQAQAQAQQAFQKAQQALIEANGVMSFLEKRFVKTYSLSEGDHVDLATGKITRKTHSTGREVQPE